MITTVVQCCSLLYTVCLTGTHCKGRQRKISTAGFNKYQSMIFILVVGLVFSFKTEIASKGLSCF